MKLKLVERNVEITSSLKDYTTKKLEHLYEHFSHIENIHVALHVEHYTHVAEATVYIDGTELHAKADSKDMYESIGLLSEKLLTLLTKHKDKHIDLH